MQEKDNHLCQCGHVKRQHNGGDYMNHCMAWIEDGDIGSGYCGCELFKLDNLRYLESLASKNVT